MDNDKGRVARCSVALQPGCSPNIIKGILGGKLEWLAHHRRAHTIAVTLEIRVVSCRCRSRSGMYLSPRSSTPIFIGGMLRLVTDKLRGPGEERGRIGD